MVQNAFVRVTVAIGALSVAACGGQSGSIPGSRSREPSYATQADEARPVSLLAGGVPAESQESVLHSFADGSDGDGPFAGLTNVNGVLYGTTPYGGPNGEGTVFKITTSGQETVLHAFGTGSDGQYPFSGLTNVNGVLYGTTVVGGTNGIGTVFKITTSGTESVLYNFAGGSDGEETYASLTDLNGVLYGTTTYGGVGRCSLGCGTVFKITMSGAESVLYSFAGGGDGQNPHAGLTGVNGVLYGTTVEGGANGGNGTVFKITTSGAESVLYSFAGSDGAQPFAGLTNVNGVLYGTTKEGGGSGSDLGTVFKITTPGSEKVLHNFGGGNDGQNPLADLSNVNGVLYGTTLGGRDGKNGTAFRITTSGAKSGLYIFAGRDGAQPEGALTDVNGVLYGTTSKGGANKLGTVFALSL